MIVSARPPQPPAAERLEQARLLVAEGEDDRARQILATFTAADEAALPPSACRLLDGLRETLLLAARDRLPDDLAAGLDGNLARLRSAVDTGIAQPELVAALSPEAQADFGRARRAMELYIQAEGAARNGEHPAVLEHLAALLALSPELTDPEELRKKSADALEAEAVAEQRSRGPRPAENVAEPRCFVADPHNSATNAHRSATNERSSATIEG